MNTVSSKTGLTLAVLCAASFAMVTTEFAPIGLLSAIARSLDNTAQGIAYTVAMYAWVGAASGLLAAQALRLISRRRLLALLMLVMAASNIGASCATGLTELMLARILGAIAHGLFWATAAATAQMLVPPKRTGFAVSLVMFGITLATVLGVPLTNMLGALSNWRVAFLILSGVCLVCAILLGTLLPNLIELPQCESSLLRVLRTRKDLVLTYLITGLTAAAHFAAYTFIEPLVTSVPHLTPYDCAALLFLFGAAGFAGNLASALFTDRYLLPLTACTLVLMTASLWTLSASFVGGFYPMAMLLIIWGASIASLFTALQTWVLKIAGAQTVAATAIHTAVLNGAIGLGVAAGGQIYTAFGLDNVMIFASSLLVPALILILRIWLWQPHRGLSDAEKIAPSP